MSNIFKELEALLAVIQAWPMTNQTNIGQGDTGAIKVEGVPSEFIENDTPLEDKKLLEIHIKNYREKLSVYKPVISAVIDQPDFQPVSFLQLGLEKSYAVCRISRYYSKDTLQDVFNNLKNTAEKLDANLDKLSFLNPMEELKRIFLIPNNLFNKIFSKIIQSEIEITFVNSIECLKENIDEILKLNPLPLGTGFLVGNSHLLTNHHVIPKPEIAQECVAQFGYEDQPTKIVKVLDYEFDSKLLFVTNPQLDYTLIQLQTDMYNKRPAGYNFGWLDLIESEENIAPGLKKEQVEKLIKELKKDDSYTSEKLNFYGLTQGKSLESDRVAIIQHPKGRKKEIILQNNEVTRLSLENLDYKADTDYGSSGSPVFNMNWKLVALTKRVIPKLNRQDNQQDSQISHDNRSNAQNSASPWGASQGTRICRIVEDLKIKSFMNPKLQSFIQDFVFTSEQLNFPPLPSGLEFDGDRSYVDLSVDKGLDTIDEITVEVWVQRHRDSGYGVIIHQPNAYRLYWWVGKLFLELYNGTSEQNCFRIQTERQCLNDALWHHVAFIYNSKTKENPTIYVDGEKQDISPVIIFPSEESIPLESIFFNNTRSFKDNLFKVYIGCRKDNSNYFDYFKCSISEIRYWKVARDKEQIKQNMNRRLDVTKEEGLLGYWRFEEGKGYRVYNLAPKPKIDSSRDTALEFNGVSDYVDCGNDESLKFDKAITMESWFNLNEKPPQGFIINQGGSGGEPGYSLWFFDKDTIRVELCDDNKSQILFDTKHNCHDDSWHHIAFTWSMAPDSNQSFQIYIDGEQKAIKYSFIRNYKNGITTVKEFPESNESIYQTKVDNSYFQNGIGKPKVNLNIGRAEEYTCCYFNGAIAEVRLWNIALNEQQVIDKRERRLDVANEEGLLGYWRFEEVEGDTVYNLASKSKSSAVIKQTTIDSIRDTGLEFNGFSDYIDCGKSKSLIFDKAITMESRFKLNEKSDQGYIINHGGSWGEPGYSLWFFEKDTIRVELCDHEGSQILFDTKHNFHKESWYHIAFTWFMASDSTQSFQMYIDGEKKIIEYKPLRKLQNQLNPNNFPENDGNVYHLKLDKSFFKNGIGQPKVNLNIGRAENYAYYFKGCIAEVRLWNIARTEQQIKENIKVCLDTTKEAELVGYWQLDEEEGDKAEDSSKNAIVGNVYGGKWLKPYYLMEKERDVFGVAFKTKRLTASQYPALPLTFGLKFSNREYYDCGNDKFNTPKAITVEAWVKQTFGDCLIVNCVNGNGDLLQDSDILTGYSLSWYQGEVRVILSDAVSKNRTIVYSKNAPSDNMWHHIAFTWSPEQEGEISIYIDGRYQDCIVEGKSNALIIQGRSKMTGIFTDELDNLKTNLTIGKRVNNENDTYRDFEIAEVRLWNVARTQQQIQANMGRRLNSQYFQSNGDKEGLEEQNNLDELVGYWRLDDVVNAQDYS